MRRINYGKEWTIDLHECNITNMTKEGITAYLNELCDAIGMIKCGLHFWDEEYISKEEWDSSPHLQGISACQFIKTSSIIVHAIYGMQRLYVNCFSCKDFDEIKAENITGKYFGGIKMNTAVLTRF